MGPLPLNVGWRHRTATPAQRTAPAVRDKHCQAPGCARPPQWCDAHHLKPWYHGGRTDLNNLILLCRRHHRAVHQRTWRLHTLGGGKFHFEHLRGVQRQQRELVE
ncbi:MAG: HNH endonuclease [Actinomycetota bacterium]|nr:HNH endonuclease [Actinomycetota bacterium]